MLRCGATSPLPTHHALRPEIYALHCCIEESEPRCHNQRANDKHRRQMIRHATTDKSTTYDLQAARRIMHVIIIPLARFPPARRVPPSANARPFPSVLSPSFHHRSICVASLPVKRRRAPTSSSPAHPTAAQWRIRRAPLALGAVAALASSTLDSACPPPESSRVYPLAKPEAVS